MGFRVWGLGFGFRVQGGRWLLHVPKGEGGDGKVAGDHLEPSATNLTCSSDDWSVGGSGLVTPYKMCWTLGSPSSFCLSRGGLVGTSEQRTWRPCIG